MKNAALKDGIASNSIGEGTDAPGFQPLTAELIADRITAGVSMLALAFTEMENRIVADNGKRYPVDASLPDGVQDTGNVELVNRYSFVERTLIGSVVWKLETMVAQSAERIDAQKDKIRQAVRQIDSGRTDEAIVNRMADFLETLVEQHAMLVAGFTAALETHAVVLGIDYETKAMREERARLAQSAAPTSTSERLARLGVTPR